MDFEEWKARLAGLLRRGSRELNTLEQWIQYHSAYFAQIGSPDLTDTGTLLEAVFECTQPEVFSKVELSKYQSTAKQLYELLPRIEASIGALKSTNSCLVPKDGMPGRRYSNLQRSLKKQRIRFGGHCSSRIGRTCALRISSATASYF